MFSVRTILASAALGVSGLALVAPVSAEAGVVIKSSGPSASQFPVGKKLNDRGRITLKSGDAVTVLANGRTRIISGAGTHRVSARGSSKRSTFAALTRQRSNSRVRTGATRAPDGFASLTRPNIWYVDVSQSGKMCVSNLDAVRLWRPDRETASTYVVANSASPEDVAVNFAEGVMISDWDTARMPLADGSAYSLTAPGADDSVSITFAQLEETPRTPEALAEALIAQGCTGQLDLLAATLM